MGKTEFRSIAAFILPVILLGSCKQVENDRAGEAPDESALASPNESALVASNAKSMGANKAMMVDPVTAVSAGLSIASSLKSLFGKNADNRDLKAIKRKLNEISAQNTQILQTLGEIVAVLNNLGVTIRQNVRLETIFEKQARLMGEARQLTDVRIAELEDRRAQRQAAQRYRNDILPDVRDVTRQLMDEGYGYSAYDTVGQGMMMEFWMSRRLGERSALRRNDAGAFLAYFTRAMSPEVEGAPGKLLADATAQRDRLKQVLDAADARIGASGWEVMTRNHQRSRSSGRRTDYEQVNDYEKVSGNQRDGYRLSRREEVVRRWSVTEPSDIGPRCPMCNVLEANAERAAPANKALAPDPMSGADTPAARSGYWNAVRAAMIAAEKEISIWSKVSEALRLYRSEAEAVSQSG